MFYYKLYTANGIEYAEMTEELDNENAVPLTEDEYYEILQQLIAEDEEVKE